MTVMVHCDEPTVFVMSYLERDWPAWVAACQDSFFERSWAAWKKGQRRDIEQLKKQGRKVSIVALDVRKFTEWADENGKPKDEASRLQCAVENRDDPEYSLPPGAINRRSSWATSETLKEDYQVGDRLRAKLKRLYDQGKWGNRLSRTLGVTHKGRIVTVTVKLPLPKSPNTPPKDAS